MRASKRLFELLQSVPRGLDLRIGEIASGDSEELNITLDFVKDGDVVGPCPLIEITPEGGLVEQEMAAEVNNGVALDPIEAVKLEIGLAEMQIVEKSCLTKH